MKKYGFLLAVMTGLWVSSNAQVHEDKLNVLGSDNPALRIDINSTSKVVSTALADKLKQAGVKTGSSKGLITATGVKMVEVSPELMDYYFKVTALDKTRSYVQMSISKGYTNFVSPQANPQVWDNAQLFLENLVPHVARYQLQEDAKTMEKTVSAAQKNYDKSVKDYKKQEEALTNSRKAMEAAESELNGKKSELDALQQKIKR